MHEPCRLGGLVPSSSFLLLHACTMAAHDNGFFPEWNNSGLVEQPGTSPTSTGEIIAAFPGQPYGASCTGETLPSWKAGEKRGDPIDKSVLLDALEKEIPVIYGTKMILVKKCHLEYQAQGMVRSYWKIPAMEGRACIGVKIQHSMGVQVFADLVDERVYTTFIAKPKLRLKNIYDQKIF